MNESTSQQVCLFIISFAILLYSGDYMLCIAGIKTLFDFCIGMLFFYSLIFTAIYFFKLSGRILTIMMLIRRKKTLML